MKRLFSVLVLVLTAVGVLAGTASAAIGHSRYWYDQATCSAFSRWYHNHHNPRYVYSLSQKADTYLRVDVYGWYHHAEDSTWTRYVNLDCTTSGD